MELAEKEKIINITEGEIAGLLGKSALPFIWGKKQMYMNVHHKKWSQNPCRSPNALLESLHSTLSATFIFFLREQKNISAIHNFNLDFRSFCE